MKILHVVWGMKNGGIENMLADIINVQVKTEDVTLLVINDMVDKSIISRIDDKCKMVFLKRKVHSKSPWFAVRINCFILKKHFDIIHLHYQTLMNYIFIPANYVRTVHNTNQSIHNYRWNKAIVAISESVKQELDEKGYTNSLLINNGINFDLITTKNSFHRQGKVFKMVQVSRILFSQKGQDIMLNILAGIIDKGYSSVHLDFIGDGEDIGKLKELVAQKKLQNFVSILGNKSREYIYGHLCDYDLFIQPSRFEGFGLTVVEAMAAKVPVLVSQNEGPLQIIENGTYGYSFVNGNVEDAAEKIIDIIEKYPSIKFIEDAFVHARNLYSVDRTAEEYMKTYKRVLKNKDYIK